MKLLHFFLACICGLSAMAQGTIYGNGMEGYYEGALIRGNSVALLTAEIYKQNDSLFIRSNVKEWTYYSGKRSHIIVIDRVLYFQTYYGRTAMVFDSTYSEMVGHIENSDPQLKLHLKKVRRPVQPALKVKEFKVPGDSISLNASLIVPLGYKQPMACAIFVSGRGCSDRQQHMEKARVLASYGMATVVFDKRGAPGNSFDCNQTTIQMHTTDLVHVIRQVAGMKEIAPEKIGLIGNSYGGWVAPRAAAKSPQKIAFIISLVGPATSIRRQQMDNAVYYVVQELDGNKETIQQIQEYIQTEYETGDDERTFRKLNKLLVAAEEKGWLPILEKSDIANTAEEVPNLWVKRNQYDPSEDLKDFQGPFLSLLGERDDVVPWQENSERFHKLFQSVGKTNYRIVVLPETPHWLEHGNVERDLGYYDVLNGDVQYFKFDRVSPGVMNEMLSFLRDYQFLPIE